MEAANDGAVAEAPRTGTTAARQQAREELRRAIDIWLMRTVPGRPARSPQSKVIARPVVGCGPFRAA